MALHLKMHMRQIVALGLCIHWSSALSFLYIMVDRHYEDTTSLGLYGCHQEWMIRIRMMLILHVYILYTYYMCIYIYYLPVCIIIYILWNGVVVYV